MCWDLGRALGRVSGRELGRVLGRGAVGRVLGRGPGVYRYQVACLHRLLSPHAVRRLTDRVMRRLRETTARVSAAALHRFGVVCIRETNQSVTNQAITNETISES